MTAQKLSLDKRGAVAHLALNRTTLDVEFARELADACEAIAADASVRVVLLAGEGEVFSTGWERELLQGDGEGAAVRVPPGDPFGCLAELSRPVVCALNGDALGAGLELALACDVRIAAEGAHFGLPDIGLGLLPMAGGSQRLPRLVGKGRALEMILTGEQIDAQEALRIGLVSAVVPRDRLLAEAVEIANRIAERGPLAVQYAKEAVSRGLEMPLEQALRYENDLTVILQTTEDRAEGVGAFLDKRTPEFKGK
jgi:enoyl-CoA hydratase/carnithine racemase